MAKAEWKFIDIAASGCIVSLIATMAVGMFGGRDVVLAIPLLTFFGFVVLTCIASALMVIGGD